MVCGGICTWSVGAAGVKYAVCIWGCGAYPGGACAAVLPISNIERRPSNLLKFDLDRLVRSEYFTIVSVSDSSLLIFSTALNAVSYPSCCVVFLLLLSACVCNLPP